MKKGLLFATLLCFLAPSMISEADAAPHKKISRKKKQNCRPVKKAFKARKVSVAAPKKACAATGPVRSSKVMKLNNAEPRPAVQPVAASTNNDLWGGYIGVNLGYTQLSGTQRVRVAIDQGGDRFYDAGITGGGLGADINFGWIFKLGNFGLGAELYYDPLEMKSTATSNLSDSGDETCQLKFKGTTGFVMKLGYYLSPEMLPYFRFGFESQSMDVSFSDGFGGNAPPIHKTVKVHGIATGFGARYQLTRNIIAQGEYRVGLYQSKQVENYVTADQTQVKTQPHVHDFRVGVAYQF